MLKSLKFFKVVGIGFLLLPLMLPLFFSETVFSSLSFWQAFGFLLNGLIIFSANDDLIKALENKEVLDVKKYKTLKLANKYYVLFSILCYMFGYLVLLLVLMATVTTPAPVLVPFLLGLVISILFVIPARVLILKPYKNLLEDMKEKEAADKKAEGKGIDEYAKAQLQEKRKKKQEEAEKTREDAILHLESLDNENTLEYEKLEERIKKYQSNIEEEKEVILVLQEKYPFIGQIVTNRLV